MTNNDTIREALKEATAEHLRHNALLPPWASTAEDALDRMEDEMEADKARIRTLEDERDALATQLAHEWGWPDADSVLTRLRGDRTAALVTFTEASYLAYLATAETPAR